MMIAYSYARFSSARQASGDSLRRQSSQASAYCEKHGLQLDSTLVDRGVSSFRGKNRLKGALGSFLRMVEEGEIAEGSYLLVDSMDRLSREDVVQASHTLMGIALAGVTVVTLNNGFAFDRHAQLPDVVIAVAEITRSHAESAEKGRKVKEAHGESKRRAREEGIVWSKSGPSWLRLNPATRKFEPLPERVDVVRRIFAMAVDQGMGTTVIAQRLNQEGVAPFRGGKQWHGTTIVKILRSRAVLGDYQPRFADGSPDGEPAVGYYGEAVVDLPRFLQVQRQLDSKRVRGRRPAGSELRNLFRGLCRCSECDGNMHLHRRFKDKVDLYECAGLRVGTCTNRRRIRSTTLEAFVLEHVPEVVLHAPTDVGGRRRAAEVAAAERDDLAAMVQRLLDRLEDPEFATDPLLIERYRSRRSQLDKKAAEAERLRELAEAAQHQPPASERQDEIRYLRDQLAGLSGTALYDARSKLAVAIRAVVDRITFSPTGLVAVETQGRTVLRVTFAAGSSPSVTVNDVVDAVEPDDPAGRTGTTLHFP